MVPASFQTEIDNSVQGGTQEVVFCCCCSLVGPCYGFCCFYPYTTVNFSHRLFPSFLPLFALCLNELLFYHPHQLHGFLFSFKTVFSLCCKTVLISFQHSSLPPFFYPHTPCTHTGTRGFLAGFFAALGRRSFFFFFKSLSSLFLFWCVCV